MTQIERLKKALDRLDYYDAPADDSPVFVCGDDETLFELIDRNEGDGDNMDEATVITLGDLRQLVEEAKA